MAIEKSNFTLFLHRKKAAPDSKYESINCSTGIYQMYTTEFLQLTTIKIEKEMTNGINAGTGFLGTKEK